MRYNNGTKTLREGAIIMKKQHKNEDLADFQARRKKCNTKRRAKDRTRGRCSK